MKLADRSETRPFFLDQAAIALMQLSINHLQLLETLAEELQALTHASSRVKQPDSESSPQPQDKKQLPESTWER
jgi:hypothetical protein